MSRRGFLLRLFLRHVGISTFLIVRRVLFVIWHFILQFDGWCLPRANIGVLVILLAFIFSLLDDNKHRVVVLQPTEKSIHNIVMIYRLVAYIASYLLLATARKQFLKEKVLVELVHDVGAELLLKEDLAAGFGRAVELEFCLIVKNG
jgi:hypothetical protein